MNSRKTRNTKRKTKRNQEAGFFGIYSGFKSLFSRGNKRKKRDLTRLYNLQDNKIKFELERLRQLRSERRSYNHSDFRNNRRRTQRRFKKYKNHK